MTGLVVPPARAAFRLARGSGARAARARLRLRRRWLLASLRLRALWLRARVDCDVAGDVVLGRRVRVEVEPHSRSSLQVGPLCRLGDDVRIHLRGGHLQLGRAVDVRHGCLLEVAGRLELRGPNLVQHHSSIHCDESVRIGRHAVLSELVTVVDSTHPPHGAAEWFLDNLRTAPVEIGARAWLGAKATVGRGVRVGERSVVSANSLVVRDVPDGWLASGVPADALRPVDGGRGEAAQAGRHQR